MRLPWHSRNIRGNFVEPKNMQSKGKIILIMWLKSITRLNAFTNVGEHYFLLFNMVNTIWFDYFHKIFNKFASNNTQTESMTASLQQTTNKQWKQADLHLISSKHRCACSHIEKWHFLLLCATITIWRSRHTDKCCSLNYFQNISQKECNKDLCAWNIRSQAKKKREKERKKSDGQTSGTAYKQRWFWLEVKYICEFE